MTPQPHLAQSSLGHLPPGRDQRHILPGRTTSSLWRHVGTPLWSTWVSKGPRRGFRGRGKPTATCWPDHLCVLQCRPRSCKNGDRWWSARAGRWCCFGWWKDAAEEQQEGGGCGLGARSELGAGGASQATCGRATGHRVWDEILLQPHQKLPETLLHDAAYLPCLG